MIYKRGKLYWYKFMWNGKLVRESTKQGNDQVASATMLSQLLRRSTTIRRNSFG